ncbi:MAG: PSD1 and planctomycete cytochrome C domain-containing protein [Pirellulales bacterium]
MVCFVLVTAVQADVGGPAGTIQFNRDVRPILSNHCFACHGQDGAKREAGLRLDTVDAGEVELESGETLVVPGEPAESELYRRVSTDDVSMRMPPEDFGKQLTAEQVNVLRRWIEEGGRWQQHWSFVPPTRPPVPEVSQPTWARGTIDRFVLARLDAEGLSPSSVAEPHVLVRRLSVDLTGLPPDPEVVAAFAADPSDDAYEALVDALLGSPHYGERMAVPWLDLVRYADTVGYHGDQERQIAPYRDYVINALNDNMPFDQFTIEQLAGDLLPDATTWQRVASGYNMLGRTTIEGGAQAKEYLAKYAADRVRTTATTWLGATMGCAECHDHKYDPYTTKDFYSLAAFFAGLREKGVGDPVADLSVPDDEQADELARLDAAIATAEARMAAASHDLPAAQASWETSLAATSAADVGGDADTAAGSPAADALAELPEALRNVVEIADPERNDEQRRQLAEYYRNHVHPKTSVIWGELTAARDARQAFATTVRHTIPAVAVPPREMRVLRRGDWMDDGGETVIPAVPHFLPQIDTGGERATRLDLARWMVASDQPLTARVYVNRLWKLFFGTGLSKVLDDVGSQGEWPTHPALLDWMAVEFVESGWDVKHMVRLIVTSSAYRQSSDVSPELRQRDPYNRLIARQSRFRLDAEFVRDNALAISGLLVDRVGGESVRPYQPFGYYAHLNFPKRTYHHDSDDRQYRRGVYVHWQRTFLHPALLAFDAPSREECTADRPRSNTPLAALVLLNDPSFVEAARVLAAQMVRTGATVGQRIDWAFRRAVARDATDEERAVLTDLYARHLAHYVHDPDAALEVGDNGKAPLPDDIDPVELAAWTSVARTILNLHETITRY